MRTRVKLQRNALQESAKLDHFTRVSKKPKLPIRCNFETLSHISNDSDSPLRKQSFLRNLTDAGIEAHLNAEEDNTWFSIPFSLEPLSNVTSWSDLQDSEHDLESTLTDAAITIIVKPLEMNARDSIRYNREKNSKL
jgi:hypothetical protein